MSTTSGRNIDVNLTGDVAMSSTYSAAENTASPGQVQVVALTTGANTIIVPAAGTTPKAVTIVKPSGNIVAITFKGIAGDTGVRLHDTDPDSISLNAAVATFVLNAGSAVNVRLVWT